MDRQETLGRPKQSASTCCEHESAWRDPAEPGTEASCKLQSLPHPSPPPTSPTSVPSRSTRSYRPLLTALSSAGSQTTEAMRFCLVFLLLDSWCLSPPQPRLLFVVKGFDFYREGSFFRLFTPLEKHTIKIIKYTHQDGTLPYQK